MKFLGILVFFLVIPWIFQDITREAIMKGFAWLNKPAQSSTIEGRIATLDKLVLEGIRARDDETNSLGTRSSMGAKVEELQQLRDSWRRRQAEFQALPEGSTQEESRKKLLAEMVSAWKEGKVKLPSITKAAALVSPSGQAKAAGDAVPIRTARQELDELDGVIADLEHELELIPPGTGDYVARQTQLEKLVKGYKEQDAQLLKALALEASSPPKAEEAQLLRAQVRAAVLQLRADLGATPEGLTLLRRRSLALQAEAERRKAEEARRRLGAALRIQESSRAAAASDTPPQQHRGWDGQEYVLAQIWEGGDQGSWSKPCGLWCNLQHPDHRADRRGLNLVDRNDLDWRASSAQQKRAYFENLRAAWQRGDIEEGEAREHIAMLIPEGPAWLGANQRPATQIVNGGTGVMNTGDGTTINIGGGSADASNKDGRKAVRLPHPSGKGGTVLAAVIPGEGDRPESAWAHPDDTAPLSGFWVREREGWRWTVKLPQGGYPQGILEEVNSSRFLEARKKAAAAAPKASQPNSPPTGR